MRFAWDEDKNTSNFYKHGLWLEDAWAVFQGPMTIRVDDRRDYGETRYVALGCLENTIVFLAYALRDGAVRVISMRRANKAERKIYEAEAQV